MQERNRRESVLHTLPVTLLWCGIALGHRRVCRRQAARGGSGKSGRRAHGPIAAPIEPRFKLHELNPQGIEVLRCGRRDDVRVVAMAVHPLAQRACRERLVALSLLLAAG